MLPAFLPPTTRPAAKAEPVVTPAAPVMAVRPAAPVKPATPVAHANYDHLLDMSGHDRNYAWITGVLTRKQGFPGVWFIHYQPSDAVADMHGGRLPIQTRASFEGLREGDLVTIIGYIITNADVAPGQRMTAFAADQVNKIQK